MLKKTLFAGGGALLLMVFLFGRDAVSYISTTAAWINDSVREKVPVNFELERARNMIADLTPEVRRNMHLIAKEEVDVERLTEQVARLEARQRKGREGLMRVKAELDRGSQYLYCGATTYGAEEAKELMANRFERFKTDDQTLANLRKVLASRTKSLEAARKKLEGMLAAKQQLAAEVASLEARQKMVEVAQTTSDLNLDDSHLARTKDLIRDIETRIQVDERLADANLESRDDILIDDVESPDVSEEIAQYFGIEGSPAVAEVTVDPQL
jgi:phage shock protein A